MTRTLPVSMPTDEELDAAMKRALGPGIVADGSWQLCCAYWRERMKPVAKLTDEELEKAKDEFFSHRANGMDLSHNRHYWHWGYRAAERRILGGGE